MRVSSGPIFQRRTGVPIYEYECKNGHRFEKRQKISDAPVTECEICKAPVQRLISGSSFLLKGGGWYADAYQKGSQSSSSNSNVSSKPGGEKVSEKSTTETKSAPATPKKTD